MERAATTSIQVLLQAAEFLELRELRQHPLPPGLTEAEHGYASLCPARSRRAVGSVRRAQLRCCLERLKQQVPVGAGPARPTTLSLLHRARLHIQVSGGGGPRTARGRSLRQRLEWLLLPTDGERARANSLDSSQHSEPSEGEDAEIEVDGVVFSGDLLPSFGTGRDHSYSSLHSPES
ncbi:MAD3 protein, partial [Sclerurus mexicanus]|nr:MAD3 protein [Sclerurus mexicanus]